MFLYQCLLITAINDIYTRSLVLQLLVLNNHADLENENKISAVIPAYVVICTGVIKGFAHNYDRFPVLYLVPKHSGTSFQILKKWRF